MLQRFLALFKHHILPNTHVYCTSAADILSARGYATVAGHHNVVASQPDSLLRAGTRCRLAASVVLKRHPGSVPFCYLPRDGGAFIFRHGE